MADKYNCIACGVESDEPGQCPDCGSELSGDQVGESTDQSGLSKIITAIVVIVALGVGVILAQLPGDDQSSKAEKIEKILKRSLEVNSKTPMMIDASTSLDKVVVAGETIIYKTTLVNLSGKVADKDVATRDLFKKKIGPFLAEKYCNDKYSREALELGVKYGNEYFGKDGALLYTATISIDDC